MSNDYRHQTISQDFLGNSSRIFFLNDESNVKNTNLISYGGIDGTVKMYDVSSLPKDVNHKSMVKMINDAGDKMPVLGTVRFQCESREMGDLKLDILSPNGDVVLTMKRVKRLGVLWLADGEKEIPATFSDGTTAAILHFKKTGADVEIEVAGEKGLSFRRWTPSWQAQTKWLLFAFLCFLPTAGIGGCFGFYKASSADVVQQMAKHSGETVIDLGKSLENVITFEGASSWKEKLTLLFLGAFVVTDKLTEKPVSHHSAGNHF